MPLLTELENHFVLVLQRFRAYGASRGDCNHVKIHVGVTIVLADTLNLTVSRHLPLASLAGSFLQVLLTMRNYFKP